MQPSILPSLSTDGWVFATAEKADYLISHFFVAEYSQTQLYVSHVSSFPKIIQQNQETCVIQQLISERRLINIFHVTSVMFSRSYI